MILLDTLYPPAPAQLVADCLELGAGGCWVYAARRNAAGADVGIGGWTASHVDLLHEAALGAPAIIVPGSAPADVGPMLDAADELGCDLPTAYDLEMFSTPPASWLVLAIAATRTRGRRPLRYGDGNILANYPPADGDWWSHGAIPVRSGQLEPVPPLPPGLVADQYVVDVIAGGRAYDASVADPVVFSRGALMNLMLLKGDEQPAPGPRGTGAVFLCLGQGQVPWVKRWLETPGDEQPYVAELGQPQTVPQWILDRALELEPISGTTYARPLDELLAAIAALPAASGGLQPAKLGAALRAAAHELDGQ